MSNAQILWYPTVYMYINVRGIFAVTDTLSVGNFFAECYRIRHSFNRGHSNRVIFMRRCDWAIK